MGLEAITKPIKIIKINNKIQFKDGERFIIIEPKIELRY